MSQSVPTAPTRVIRVRGGRTLRGTIRTEGAKNAVLPLLTASLLTDEPVTLENVPAVEDVRTMGAMLARLGKHVRADGDTYGIREDGALVSDAPYDLVRRMRASFSVLGPLLARLGRARVPLPGGCVLGPRPVNFHLEGLRAFGAEVELRAGVVHARARRLHGAEITLDFPSVGATEHLLMTAALVPEATVIHGPAHEPEVVELIRLLEKMGARVECAPDRYTITGKAALDGARHAVIPDRLNAGTYLIAGAISGGEVSVGCVPDHLRALLVKLREAGFAVEEGGDFVRLASPAERWRGIRLETRTYPGYANDLQPQMMALLSLARGESQIRETIFADRFGQAPELVRMGADIRISGDTAVVVGVDGLEGAEVHATDIRSGAALVLAGLAAQGETRVVDAGHVARGYVDLPGTLRRLGAEVEEVV